MGRRVDEPTASRPAAEASVPRRPRGGRRSVTQLRDAAAKPTLSRLDEDRKRVSERLKPVLAAFKKGLFDHQLQIGTLWRRLEFRDKNASSWFRDEIGQTPWAYFLDCRLEVSERLVRETTLLPHQIANTLGFGQVNTFSRAFKRRYGLSPTDYRKAPPTFDVEDAVTGEPFLAVRRDVDAGRAEEVVGFATKLGLDWPSFEHVFHTHPDFAAAHWYTRWLRNRLGHAELRTAWILWRRANVDLRELLEWRPEQRAEIVRERPRTFQTDAFVWLLVDCVFVRLLEDAGEAEHFADLALVASENAPAGLRALPLALKAHAIQRRLAVRDAEGMFAEALEASGAVGVDPWVVGRVRNLYAELLYRKGKEREARRELFAASIHFKRAGDEFERMRCAVDRSSAWLTLGINPSRLMSACIPALEQHPAGGSILRVAHLNRILSTIYLTDRLTGRDLEVIKRFRDEMPSPTVGFIAVQYQRLDGLLWALEKKYEPALDELRGAANWFEDNNLLAEAAVCWLLLSWVALDVDDEVAASAALAAYRHMAATGFNSNDLQAVALRIHQDARHGTLEKSVLRQGILLAVCPKLKLYRDRPTPARE